MKQTQFNMQNLFLTLEEVHWKGDYKPWFEIRLQFSQSVQYIKYGDLRYEEIDK